MAGARYPGGSQYGARWNHIGSGYEYSLCFFDGNQNLPSFDAALGPSLSSVTLTRTYPDFAVIRRRCGCSSALADGERRSGVLHFLDSGNGRVRAVRDPARTASEGVVVRGRIRGQRGDARGSVALTIRAGPGIREIVRGARGVDDRRESQSGDRNSGAGRRIVRALRILTTFRTALAGDRRDRLDPRRHD